MVDVPRGAKTVPTRRLQFVSHLVVPKTDVALNLGKLSRVREESIEQVMYCGVRVLEQPVKCS